MSVHSLRHEISDFLGFSILETPVSFLTYDTVEEHSYLKARRRATHSRSGRRECVAPVADGC